MQPPPLSDSIFVCSLLYKIELRWTSWLSDEVGHRLSPAPAEVGTPPDWLLISWGRREKLSWWIFAKRKVTLVHIWDSYWLAGALGHKKVTPFPSSVCKWFWRVVIGWGTSCQFGIPRWAFLSVGVVVFWWLLNYVFFGAIDSSWRNIDFKPQLPNNWHI